MKDNRFIENFPRRAWIQNTGLFVTGVLLSGGINSCIRSSTKKIKTILVVSGWQDVNIGDIAHTPGLLHILTTFFREARIDWVRKTGNKVLVCPEMTYQTDIMNELLIDSLPADVKPYVVKQGYWMPDEAASVYAKAHTVLSFECHSPIISLANNTPAFYLRQPEDSIKGQMYYDLGFDDRIFEIEQTSRAQIAGRLMDVFDNYEKSQQPLTTSMKKVERIYVKLTTQMKMYL